MSMEVIAQYLIYAHAALGGLALLSGAIALSAKKGKRLHKKSGKLFYYFMLTSALTALIIAVIPNHLNPFLFCIGVFSTYLIVSGYRSLRLKRPGVDLLADKIIAGIMVITGLVMVFYPIILDGGVNVVLLVFGLLGLYFGIQDLLMFRNPRKLRNRWLGRHLGNMTGGYIAAVTAFLVVNDVIGGLFNWFLPTVIGTIYITYWIRKIKPRSKKSVAD